MMRTLLLALLPFTLAHAQLTIGGEGLYWQTCGKPFIYAFEIDDPDPLPPVSAFVPRIIKPKQDWGFRLYADYECGLDRFSVGWTHYQSSRSEQLFNSPGKVIRLIPCSETIGVTPGDAHLRYDYDKVSARASHLLCDTASTQLFGYVGGRYAHMESKRGYQIPTANSIVTLREKGTTDMVGVELGLHGETALWRCVRLVGHVGGVAGVGRVRDRYDLSDPGSSLCRVNIPYRETQCIPGIDFKLGLSYLHRTRCMEWRGEVGYAMDHYWNALYSARLVSAIPVGSPSSPQHLGFAGPYFSLRGRYGMSNKDLYSSFGCGGGSLLVGGSGLIWKGCVDPYQVARTQPPLGRSPSTLDRTEHFVKPGYDWGVRVFLGYETCDHTDRLIGEWTYFQTSSSSRFAPRAETTLFPFADDQVVSPISASMALKYNRGGVRLERRLCSTCGSQLFGYGGLRYVAIDLHQDYAADLEVRSTFQKLKRENHAFGFELGMGGEFCLWQDLKIVGRMGAFAGVGRERFELAQAVPDPGTPVLDLNASQTTCLPGMDLKLGLQWGCGFDRLELTAEVGYAMDHYWNALVSSPVQGAERPDLRAPRNVSFAGPYFSLTGRFGPRPSSLYCTPAWCGCGVWTVGAQALYWKPCVADFTPAAIDVAPILAPINVRADYAWGFEVFSEYVSQDGWNSLSLDWTHLRATNSIQLAVGQQIVVPNGFLTAPSKAISKQEYDKVRLRAAHLVHVGRRSCLFGYGGVRYIYLKSNRGFGFSQSSQTILTYREQNENNAGGFEVGLMGQVALPRGFQLFSEFGGVAAVGSHRHRALSSAFGIPESRFVFPSGRTHYSEVLCFPGIDWKAGLSFGGCIGRFMVAGELGWSIDYYWNALRAVDAWTFDIDSAPTTDIGFSGPYVQIRASF